MALQLSQDIFVHFSSLPREYQRGGGSVLQTGDRALCSVCSLPHGTVVENFGLCGDMLQVIYDHEIDPKKAGRPADPTFSASELAARASRVRRMCKLKAMISGCGKQLPSPSFLPRKVAVPAMAVVAWVEAADVHRAVWFGRRVFSVRDIWRFWRDPRSAIGIPRRALDSSLPMVVTKTCSLPEKKKTAGKSRRKRPSRGLCISRLCLVTWFVEVITETELATGIAITSEEKPLIPQDSHRIATG